MDRTNALKSIFHEILNASFDRPVGVPQLINQKVSRNRSLSSVQRRDLVRLIHQSMRWRRRLWGEIAPSSISMDRIETMLKEAEALVIEPPYVKWSRLPVDRLAQELSFPTWIIELWIQYQGLEQTINLALALNEPANTCLRVNTIKTDREQLLSSLKNENIDCEPCVYSPLGIKLSQRTNLHALKAFKKGWFEIQDEGSQMTVLLTKVKPGDFVIDACCRTGGKSLALAALMENRGSIVASDIDARVFDEFSKRAKRAGASIVKHQWVARDDPQPLSTIKTKADLVFVDAPCSGFGILRRKSWAKWNLKKNMTEDLQKTQSNVLKKYSQYVKLGGRLVYVTCTINPNENENVCDNFLKNSGDVFAKETTKYFRPDVEGTDGFFAASFYNKG
ncbi:MAG: class I SAM-dependent methyltransferase [Bdellovibrionales bacterium]|nr:class I SAM-dependent methyltransferase [Bdellovibrionales bacterium]